MVGETSGTGRRWPLWTALGLLAALTLCIAPVSLGIMVLRSGPDARWNGVTATATASPKPAPSPGPGDPTPVVAAWLRDRMSEALTQQATALLAGDEKGFLAVADPAAPATAALRRQYASLRGLRIAKWEPELSTTPTRQADGQWRALVRVDHCFATPTCIPTPVTIGTRWADTPAGVRLVAVESSLSAADGPRPWEVDQLYVRAGKRVIVATTAALRRDLPRVLAEADRAATVADRYAVGGPPPAHYLVFYAGPAEWKRWYGGGRPGWTAGYAVPVGGGDLDVVINAAAPHRTRLDDLLRHEMTHASSMPGSGFDPATWWLVEGVAELAATGGVPTSQYDGLADVRRFVRDSDWNGPLDTLAVAPDAADWQVAAAYGIGYIAVRHLADRFGEPDVLAFLEAVVHNGRSPRDAAREVFGQSWDELSAQCVAAVRAAVS